VAQVAVAARGAVGHRGVLAARCRVAAVCRAGVQVVAVERGARGADAGEARLGTVAGVTVSAGRPVDDRVVLTPEEGVAGVRGARVRVVASRRRARLARPGDARLGAVAEVAVVAVGVEGARLPDAGDAYLAAGAVGVRHACPGDPGHEAEDTEQAGRDRKDCSVHPTFSTHPCRGVRGARAQHMPTRRPRAALLTGPRHRTVAVSSRHLAGLHVFLRPPGAGRRARRWRPMRPGYRAAMAAARMWEVLGRMMRGSTSRPS